MSIDDRRLFIELVDQGSYAATARKLGLARSTVMRRIDALETQLGVPLVHRAGRALVMTEAGIRLADGLRDVFRTLDRVEEDVRSANGQAAGTVRVWLPMLGTSFLIVAALARFASQHPQIQLRVDLGRDGRSPRMGDFDVMLQMGHRRNPDLHTRTLYRDRLVLAATPAYLEQWGVPEGVADLPRHRAVEQRDGSGRVVPWRLPDGTRVRMPRAAVSTHAMGYVCKFTQHGLGIGRVPLSMTHEALRDGRLVQVLPELTVDEPISLVFLPAPSPTTRAFLDFMGQWATELTETSGLPWLGREQPVVG